MYYNPSQLYEAKKLFFVYIKIMGCWIGDGSMKKQKKKLEAERMYFGFQVVF